MPQAKIETRKKINVLLAIRGRANNERLIHAITSLKEFKASIDNPRTSRDTLKDLRSSEQYHILICEEGILSDKIINKLRISNNNRHKLPTVLVRQNSTELKLLTNHKTIDIHTLILDEMNDIGLADFLKLALHYAVINMAYENYRNEATLSDQMGGAYSYRATILPDGKFINEWLSESFEQVTGYARDEIANIGGWISKINNDDLPNIENFIATLKDNKEATVQYRITSKTGQTIWLESYGQPQWNETEQRVTGVLGGATNITSRKDVESQLAIKSQQEAALIEISEFSATDPSMKALFDKTVCLITEVLQTSLCEILATYGHSDEMMLRAGVSQGEPLYEKLIISTGKDNELHYTKDQSDIIIIDNLKNETRFKPSRHLRKHKIISGLCAPITAGNNILGILGVYKDSAHAFSSEEIGFVKAITTILGDIAAQESTEIRLKSTRQVLEKQLSQTIDTGEHVLGSLKEIPDDNISAIVQSALELHTRDNIMSATADATKALFTSTSWREGLPVILEKLGRVVEASRAYLFKVNHTATHEPLVRQQFEWLNKNIQPRQYKDNKVNLTLQEAGLAVFSEILKKGEHVTANFNDIASNEQPFYKKQNIQSILLMPIFVESIWWGFIGFDVCDNQREWVPAEVDALKISANTLATSIERNNSDSAFRSIIEGTASKTGRDFFKYLVQHLAQVFQAEYCLISEHRQDESFHMHAFWDQDKHGIPFNYSTMGAAKTPLSSTQVIYYPNNAQTHFPDDSWLRDKDIHAYLATSILGMHGESLGQLMIMDKARINAKERNLEILKVFALRAGMEMQRLKDEQNIQLLASISVDSQHLIMTSDKEGKITFKNPATDQIANKLKLKSEYKLLPDDHIDLIRSAMEKNTEIVEEKSIGDFTLQWHYHYQSDIERINLFAIDITQRYKLEERLRQDAFHDQLTGLPNRSFFNNLLNHALEHKQRRDDYNFSVLFLDLDRFKNINDSLGHAYGDDLLQKVAAILSACIRPGDYVARFGGDEFVILLDSIKSIREATNIANRIQKSLSHSIQLGQHECFTSASIGIATSERGYSNTEDILRDADIAMYSAKQRGKAQYVIFDKPMHDEIVHVLKLETDLRNALKNSELLVYYQPIYSFSQRAITSFEALVRWNHPEKGLLEPDSFISIAEDMGIIREIDHWVMQTAARQLKEWRLQFSMHKHLKMGVNLSAVHFSQMDILSQIGHLLEELQLPPDSLKLELTESIIMLGSSITSDIFRVLDQRGLKIRIDDFGVGYSSFSRLLKLPIDSLKIDRSFINSMISDAGSLNITRAIIDLAHDLGMQVIAEGVETAGQFQILGRMGCHHIQGYYISKPLPVTEATQLLIEGPAAQYA